MDTNTTQSTRINSEQAQQRQKSASAFAKPLQGAENPYTAMGHGSDIVMSNGTPLDDLLTFNFLKGNSRS